MYLVCPKCRHATPSASKKAGFNCPCCQHSWEAPAIEFSSAYFCELPALSVALLAPSGDRFPIAAFPAILGRDSDFKELQKNLAVSKTHFQIATDSHGVTVTDLASRGGTFLNASQLPPNVPQPITRRAASPGAGSA